MIEEELNMSQQLAGLADLMADDLTIGNDELLIAIDYLNKALKAASISGATPPADTLRVKHVLEHVALQRRLPLA
jgi:hypothetical protein